MEQRYVLYEVSLSNNNGTRDVGSLNTYEEKESSARSPGYLAQFGQVELSEFQH